MNKHQEALNQIKHELYAEEDDYNVSLMQELVDKATPKKPKRKLIETEDLWNETITIVGIDICDDCKNQVQHSEKFCKYCGQAMDWSEE